MCLELIDPSCLLVSLPRHQQVGKQTVHCGVRQKIIKHLCQGHKESDGEISFEDTTSDDNPVGYTLEPHGEILDQYTAKGQSDKMCPVYLQMIQYGFDVLRNDIELVVFKVGFYRFGTAVIP